MEKFLKLISIIQILKLFQWDTEIPQGLYFDKENNIIIETEHGPMGGDEINLIDLDQINKDKIFNYGWPIVSAGEHYGGKIGEK